MRHTYHLAVSVWIATALVLSVAWYWLAITPAPASQSLMVISDVAGQNQAVCPGETLVYSFSVDIREPGVYLFDASVWREVPMQIVLWTPSLNVVASERRILGIVRYWLVPLTFYDVLSDTYKPWTSGEYTRSIAITAAGRDTLPSVAAVPFTIREGCK